SRWCGVAGDDYFDIGTLGIFKFFSDVVVLIFVEIDCAGGVDFDASSGVVGKRGGFGSWIHRQMVFCVFQVHVPHLELFEKADQLRPWKCAKGVAGDSKLKLGLSSCCARMRRKRDGWHR